MPSTFDILKTGDRFRLQGNPQVFAKLTETTFCSAVAPAQHPELMLASDPESLWVEWVDPKKAEPEPKAPRYTVFPDHGLMVLCGAEYVPADLDAHLLARIADLLNQHGEG